MKFDNQELLSINGVVLYNVKPSELGSGNRIIELVGKDTYIDSAGVQFAKIKSMEARNKMNFSPTPIPFDCNQQVKDLQTKIDKAKADLA